MDVAWQQIQKQASHMQHFNGRYPRKNSMDEVFSRTEKAMCKAARVDVVSDEVETSGGKGGPGGEADRRAKTCSFIGRGKVNKADLFPDGYKKKKWIGSVLKTIIAFRGTIGKGKVDGRQGGEEFWKEKKTGKGLQVRYIAKPYFGRPETSEKKGVGGGSRISRDTTPEWRCVVWTEGREGRGRDIKKTNRLVYNDGCPP